MYFSESVRAVNAIHILDRNFQNLLEQCEKAKEELIRLRNENAQLKKELNDQRERNSEKVARNESGTNNGSTVTIT